MTFVVGLQPPTLHALLQFADIHCEFFVHSPTDDQKLHKGFVSAHPAVVPVVPVAPVFVGNVDGILLPEPHVLHAVWQFADIHWVFFVHSPTDAQKLHNSWLLTQPDVPVLVLVLEAGVAPVVDGVAPATVVVVVAPAAVVVVVAPAAVVVVVAAVVVVVAPATAVVVVAPAAAVVVVPVPVPVEPHPLFAVLTMHEPVFEPALATVQPHVPHALPQVTFMKNGLELQLPAAAHSQHCALVSVHVPVDVVPVFDVLVPVFDVPVPVVDGDWLAVDVHVVSTLTTHPAALATVHPHVPHDFWQFGRIQ
jgi:hypothetical protein